MSAQTAESKSETSALAWIARCMRSFMAVVALAAFASVGFSPSQAAACDYRYCDQGGCVSRDVIRQKAKRAFKNSSILSVLLVRGGPKPSCLIYQVKLRKPDGKGDIAFWHVNGARAR